MRKMYEKFMEAFNNRFEVEEIKPLNPDLIRIAALREALKEIRDVATISEGTEFYAMLASKALEEDEGGNE